MKTKRIKFVLFTLIAAFLLSAASGCANEPNVVININTPAPDTFSPPAKESAAPVTQTPVTQTPVTQPPATQAPESGVPFTQPPATALPKPDYSVFDNCAFVGNSVLHGLYQFGIITYGSFFTKVSLNVQSVYTQTTDTGSTPIIDELKNGNYKAVILLFGENELGWPSVDSFISKYSQLVDDVRERQPDAEIFIMGIPPVSKKAAESEKNKSRGVTNENIVIFNAGLARLAGERGCNFIPVPAALTAADGALPKEASSDGIHLNMKFSRLWADHICLSVAAGLGG